MTPWREVGLEPAAVAVVLVVVLLIYRAIARRSAALGYLVGLGLLVRLVAGVALFSISYFNVQIFSDLHTGDGFWQFAPDARSYYSSASYAAANGLGTIHDATVSPAYVKALSMWLRLFGVSPAAGFLFNLVCYVLLCGAVVGSFRSLPEPSRKRACFFAIAAFTFSPALIFLGTQTLKDTFFALLAVLIGIGACCIASSLERGTAVRWRSLLIGGAVLLPATYVAAGVRPYYAFIAWSCLGLLFVACGVRGGPPALRRVAPIAVPTMVAVWVAFVAGAGPRAAPFESLMGLDRLGTRAPSLLFAARSSYIQSGGGTSVTGPEVLDHEQHPLLVATLRSWGPAEHARAAALGLATLFVPIRLLQALSIVEFEGGRNLLFLTDIDTLFLDFSMVAAVILLVSGRSAWRPNIPHAIFTGSIALLLTILMAYVVTNYGTLVRLRVMLAISVWMLPLAVHGMPDRRPGELEPDSV